MTFEHLFSNPSLPKKKKKKKRNITYQPEFLKNEKEKRITYQGFVYVLSTLIVTEKP